MADHKCPAQALPEHFTPKAHSMPSFELLLAFLLATAVFAYMPGPSTLYAAAQTVARGKRAGWLAALGIHVGGYVHVLAAALSLAVLFQAIPALYVALKLFGAGYLLWLGAMMIARSGKQNSTAALDAGRGSSKPFWQSALVEVLNPKTAIFYVAFLPQFTDPQAGLAIWAQLLILGAVVNVMFSSADVLCVLLADAVVARFRASGLGQRIMQRLGGVVLIALGVRLALSRS